MNTKNVNILVIIPLVFILVLTFSITYALFNKDVDTSRTITMSTTDKYVGVYGENKDNIELNNNYTFTIENKSAGSANYQLYLESEGDIDLSKVSYSISGDTEKSGTLSDVYLLEEKLARDETQTINLKITSNDISEYHGSLKINTLNYDYTITYNLDGGELASNSPEGYTEDDLVTIPNPTKTGYIFLGWTGSNGNTPENNLIIPKGSTGDKSYTAVWKKEDLLVTRAVLDQGSFENVTPIYLTNQIDGTDGFKIVGHANNVYGDGCSYCKYTSWLRWDYTIDLTDVDKITFYAKEDEIHGIINVMVTDGIYDAESLGPGINRYAAKHIGYGSVLDYTYYELDTKSIKGTKVVSFIGGYLDPSGRATSATSYCNIRFIYK